MLHRDIQERHRESTVAAYRDGKIRVLFATDVAARGSDNIDVDLILQTHSPASYETFVHRSGRTRQVGKHGTCVTFHSSKKKYMIGVIEQKTRIKMLRENPPQAANNFEVSVAGTAKKIASEHSENLKLFKTMVENIIACYDTKDGALKRHMPWCLDACQRTLKSDSIVVQ